MTFQQSYRETSVLCVDLYRYLSLSAEKKGCFYIFVWIALNIQHLVTTVSILAHYLYTIVDLNVDYNLLFQVTVNRSFVTSCVKLFFRSKKSS